MLINIFNTLFGQNKARIAPANATSSVPIYEFKIATIDNSQTIDFQQFKGKKLVLLNVASKCGYTPQYADWEKFYEDNKEKVVVLGFPANNFLGQEPGSNDQIADFCNTTYGVSFPMFRKVSVKGKDQHPIYRWLSDKTLNGWNDKEPSWNFCKYVINEKGELTHFFPSDVKPDDAAFLKAME
jgi:glutathione peroxidase